MIKHIIGLAYKPWLIKHLSVTRSYDYKGIYLKIPPGVFHPKYFFSTKLLLQYISELSLKGKTFLELGAGSGLISLFASREGAIITATDINPLAVDYLRNNMINNSQSFQIILSDMFENIPTQPFDIIAINPPYYQKKPLSYADYAWYCGEKGEYFKALFSGLKNYVHENSAVCMILCDGCDRNMIENLAGQYGWKMNYVFKKGNLLENNFIIRIEPQEICAVDKPADDSTKESFINTYMRLRKAEQRIYSDEEVRMLPHVSSAHPYYKEWLIRKRSADKLTHYLRKKKKELNILEVGCGNGWLSNKLSKLPGSRVTGIEVNTWELQQADRVFTSQHNLRFVHGDFSTMGTESRLYDIVILAASVQYFSSLKKVLENIRQHFLKPDGEIHIIDSPFYRDKDMAAARLRTKRYYLNLGFPEMTPHYFHHTFSELEAFQYRFINNAAIKYFPFLKKTSPFHWICVRNI